MCMCVCVYTKVDELRDQLSKEQARAAKERAASEAQLEAKDDEVRLFG